MTRRRWIADEVDGNIAALTGAHADHLTRVLRARVGEEYDVVAAETVRQARLSAIQPGRVEFELGDLVPDPGVPQVSLLLAICKFDRMEWAIEKATELGVAHIVPVIAQRSDRRLTAAANKRVDRWRRVSLQASEQARRAAPPEILEPLKLREATPMLATTRILLSENEHATRLKDALASILLPVRSCSQLVPRADGLPVKKLSSAMPAGFPRLSARRFCAPKLHAWPRSQSSFPS